MLEQQSSPTVAVPMNHTLHSGPQVFRMHATIYVTDTFPDFLQAHCGQGCNQETYILVPSRTLELSINTHFSQPFFACEVSKLTAPTGDRDSNPMPGCQGLHLPTFKPTR